MKKAAGDSGYAGPLLQMGAWWEWASDLGIRPILSVTMAHGSAPRLPHITTLLLDMVPYPFVPYNTLAGEAEEGG